MDKLTDSGFQGSYRHAGISGVIAAGLAANAELYQWRWRDTVQLGEVRRVIISAAVSTTFFAAGVPLTFDMVKCNTWTGQGGGGTGLAPAALLKKRVSMPNSLIASGDVRTATTAGLTVGTKVLEGTPMGAIVAAGPITGALDGTILKPIAIFEVNVAHGDYPLVCATNEGFIIRAVAVPATGTWQFAVTVDWNERTAYV